MTASKSPYGVIQHPERPGVLLCYEPFNNGWRAIVFGTGEPIGVTPAIQAAIDADRAASAKEKG